MYVKTEFDWNDLRKAREAQLKLKVDELILLVLENGKVSGKTKFQKEVFLAWKEVFGPELARDPLFHPDHFGPYSQLVNELQIRMKREQVIKVISKGEGHSTYVIQDSGKNAINHLLNNGLPDAFKGAIIQKSKLLEEKKADWDEWSSRGIMTYVYRNYPEYATKTKVPVLKWE